MFIKNAVHARLYLKPVLNAAILHNVFNAKQDFYLEMANAHQNNMIVVIVLILNFVI